jgi:hypothetical protein
MTEDQIWQWAKRVGMQGMLTDVVCTFDELRAFAVLARNDEREACAAACRAVEKEQWSAYKRGNDADRGDPHTGGKSDGAAICAKAISARGEP